MAMMNIKLEPVVDVGLELERIQNQSNTSGQELKSEHNDEAMQRFDMQREEFQRDNEGQFRYS